MFKVWIVDDEPLVTDGLSRQVDWVSYNMELTGTATNGQDVLAALADHPAHLLITDISMPQMDGLTLIAKAKLICPSIRCVIISAYNEFEYVKKALQLGVENYLLKPINDSELHDTLSKTMENLLRDQMVVSQDSPDVLAFRTNILERWVNGTIQDFELYERAELLHIDLSSPAYTVCVLDVLQTDDQHSKFKFSSLLLDICRSTPPFSSGAECFIDGSFRVVAIVPEKSPRPVNDDLVAALHQISQEASEQGMIAFSAIGPLSPGSSHVSAAYQSAVFYLNYRYLDPSAVTVVSQIYSDFPSAAPDDIQNVLMQFVKALREGNLQQALLSADKFSGLRGCQTAESMRICTVPLVLSLVKTMIESGRISDELPSPVVSQLADFAALSSVDRLKSWLTQIIHQAVQVVHDRKGSYHLFIHLTLEQVNHNYGSELSLKTLATGFNVSPAYLGQLFREETGKYFNDYLTEVRLRASRNLLLETDLKINEIITRIGIPNQSYFNRVFKKMYDISPLEFRRQGLKSQS